MAGRFEKPQAALAELDLIALGNRDVRELRASLPTHVNRRAGAGGQLAVAGDEIGVQVGLDHMPDAEAVVTRGFQIDVDITLRVNDCRDALGAGHVRSVGQATEIELFKVQFEPPAAL
jgi:hypothetical protein